MKAITRKLTIFFSVALFLSVILSGGAVAMAQSNETEAATESRLLEVMLPQGAERILPQSVPAQITQALDKVIAGSNGKFRQGETEVLLWGVGAGYKKASADGIVNSMSAKLKTAGWQFQIAGEENGITVFRASQERPRSRSIVGFYGATDEALLFAAMEVIPNDAAATQAANAGDEKTESNSQATAQTETRSTTGKNSTSGVVGGGSVVGTWSDGYSSIWSGYSPATGPKSFTPGRSHLFKYVFHPNGTFEFTGLMKNTIYSCTTWVFNDMRGRYTIKGNQITLTKSKNFFRRSDSCSAANNMERDYNLEPETYTLSIRRNKYGKEEVCLSSGDSQPCYERQPE